MATVAGKPWADALDQKGLRELYDRSSQASFAVRVLQMEVIALRTAIKSRTPAEKIQIALVEFTTDTRRAALTSISAHVRDFLLARKYVETPEPDLAEVGQETT